MLRTQTILAAKLATAATLGALVCAAAGCEKKAEETKAAGDGSKPAAAASSGPASIKIDGSSTVFPITEAVAEEFQKGNKDVKVTVGVSGTGGGFKKFCAGETDISDASRPIKPTEVELCGKNKVEYIELPVAYDGIAVVVNPKNDWAEHITTEELKKIWEPEAQGKVKKWSEVRQGWPDKELHLYGAGVDSGTYDYFTEAINHKEHASRGDYTSSEDDNVLVTGISNDDGALGFFGFAYYEQNKAKLKALRIDDGKPENGAEPVAPSSETIEGGTYQPLSRPIFIYVSKKSIERPEISSFIKFYLENASKLVKEVGYVTLPARAYQLAQARVDKRVTGSLFEGKGSQVGVSIEALLAKEQEPAK